MNLSQLIARFRTDANDKAQPYFWGDDEITAWLNDAVEEAAIRGRLIHESSNASMCRIAVLANQSVYKLHPSMYELDSLMFQVTGDSCIKPVCLVSQDYLNEFMPDWRQCTGDPEYAIQSDKGLRLTPTPSRDGVLMIEGYRLPKQQMEADDDTPEINAAHHRHLIHWALHKGFSIPDTESFDPNRSNTAEAAFTQYFGIRPDSDLRRTTREDVPHHVEAYWP